jgi:hypothetical protein
MPREGSIQSPIIPREGAATHRACFIHQTQKHARSHVSITRQHGRVIVKNNVPDTSHLPHVAASATSSLLILQPIPASLPLRHTVLQERAVIAMFSCFIIAVPALACGALSCSSTPIHTHPSSLHSEVPSIRVWLTFQKRNAPWPLADISCSQP